MHNYTLRFQDYTSSCLRSLNDSAEESRVPTCIWLKLGRSISTIKASWLIAYKDVEKIKLLMYLSSMSLYYAVSPGQWLLISWLLSAFASLTDSSLETEFAALTRACCTLAGSALNDVLSSLQVPYGVNRSTSAQDKTCTKRTGKHIISRVKI